MIRRLELISILRTTSSHYQVAGMALKRQRHLVAPPPIHLPSPQQGNQHLIALGLGIVWKYKWSILKMGEHHHHPHTPWQALVVEDMVLDGKSSLTEAVVTGPGWVVLFYGWQSLGQRWNLGEAWDAAFTLTGAINWDGKQAHLNANPVSLGEGKQLITQAITIWYIKPRGPGHPRSILATPSPFNFCTQDQSPWTAKHKMQLNDRKLPGVT